MTGARPSRSELRSLTRLAWRTARTSPARSLLVVLLIALVVAVGAGMTAIGSSAVSSDDDLRRRALGDAEIAFAFSSDGTQRLQSGFERFDGQFVGPAPVPFGVEDDAEDQAQQLEARRQATRDWNAGFSIRNAIDTIEASVQPPTQLRYTRSTWPGQAGSQPCPFGCFAENRPVLDISGFDPVGAGGIVVLDGRLPTGPGELARDRRSIDRSVSSAGNSVGEAVQRDGMELTIVGIYSRGTQSGSPFDLVVAQDFDRIAQANPEASVEYRLYPEPGWLPVDQLATVRSISTAVDQPTVARTDNELLLPVDDAASEWMRRPVLTFPSGADRVEARVLPTIATVLLSVQVAFVAAAALAVAVRRRSRQYALVGVTGGSPGHVRLLVFAEALLLGLSGAVLGALVAVIAVRFIPYEAPFADGWTWGVVELGFFDVLVPAAIGLGAALLAAWWPARTVATSPPAALLGGRLPSRRPGAATLGRAAVLLGLGSAMTLLLAFQLVNASAGSTLLPLLALSILAMLGGATLAVGPILAWVGQRADRLPILARLVARDSDRGRTRSWVAIGALMVLTMIPVLIGAATKAYPNSFGANQGELDNRLVTVRTQQRWWGPPGEGPEPTSPERAAEYERIDAAIGTALGEVGTVQAEVDLVDLTGVDVVVRQTDHWSTSSGASVIVATPELVEALDLDAASRDALASGNVLDVGRHATSGGNAFLEVSGQQLRSVPVDVTPGPIYFNGAVLVAPDHPILDSVAPEVSGTIRVMAEPLSGDDEYAVRRAGNAAWDEAFDIADWGPYGPAMDLRVEQSWNDGPSAATVRLWALLITGGLSLLIAALMAALSAVELDQDLSAMVAAGAPPGLRRRFLGAHTLYHMVLAAILGVPLAILLYWLATRADDFGPRGPTVPWAVAGIVIVIIPLVVAAAVTLIFRSGRPSVSRRMT